MAPAPPVECQGHRGYGAHAPGNSLAAFRKAAADPHMQSVEFDVLNTTDGHLVVTHGPQLSSDAGVRLATLAEWQAEDLGDGERVPLFSEVIDVCLEGKLIMNVEIKPGPDAATVLRIVAMLRDKKALQVSRISSFDRGILRVVMEAEPALPIGALYHLGHRPVDPSGITPGIIYEREPEDFVKWFEDHKVEGDSVNLRVDALLRDTRLVGEARAAGKRVLVWFSSSKNQGFEEDADLYQKALALGPDVVCVNHPDLFASVYEAWKTASKRASSAVTAQDEAPSRSAAKPKAAAAKPAAAKKAAAKKAAAKKAVAAKAVPKRPAPAVVSKKPAARKQARRA